MNTPQDSSYRPPGHGQASGMPGGSQANDTVDHFADKARAEGQEQVQHYRDMAADKVDTLADSVRAAAAEMRDDEGVAHLSGHVADMADGLRRLSDGLREKSADEILRDVRRVARENPMLFIAGSIVVGFGIARFARASAPREAAQGDSVAPARSERSGDTRWTDADSAVPGTTARPATGNDSVDTAASGGLDGGAPGPAVAADAISARAGAAASDVTADRPDVPSSTDTFSGSRQP